MAYRWSLEGPAFEFPTPYGTENRFLVLRGYALIAFALLIVGVVTFANTDGDPKPALALQTLPEAASVVPHLLGAMLLTALGALDLLQAAARRTLLLAPGQPASLVPDVAREASGSSTGAANLQHLLDAGAVQPADADVRPGDARLGPGAGLAAAPDSLQVYVRQRLARLALSGGLAGLLLLAVLGLDQAPARALAAGVLLGACILVQTLHVLQPHKPAWTPWQLTALLLLALVAAGALAAFADLVPRAAAFTRLGLPLAAAVLLGSALLVESLALRAARAQLHTPWLAAIPAAEASVDFEADPEQLLREVDLELHRQWSEGVPNRRYTWQPPQLARGAQQGAYAAAVLEESQPLVPHEGQDAAPAQPQSAARMRPLLALDVLGLGWSLAGAVLWLWLAWAHMRDANASWLPAAAGLACLVAGGYAVRLGHLLWSRVEVQSIITWLDFQGSYTRLGADAADAVRSRGEPRVRVEGLRLQSRVAQARSVFYAAAPHPVASRVLLELAAHRSSAEAWLVKVQEFAHRCAPQPAQPVPAGAAAAQAARSDARSAAESAPMTKPALWCAHCGTRVPPAARFCPQCGTVLAAG